MAPQESRSKIIETVTTPLGFFVLVVLVVEVGLIGLAATYGQADRMYLGAVVFILVLLISVVAFISIFRPEALSGKRHEPIGKSLASSLAIEVYSVVDGYLEDDVKEEAYGMLKDACLATGKRSNDVCLEFTQHFSQTLIDRAKILGSAKPKGKMEEDV